MQNLCIDWHFINLFVLSIKKYSLEVNVERNFIKAFKMQNVVEVAKFNRFSLSN